MRTVVALMVAFVALALLPSTSVADVDCSDFSTQADAQAYFLAHGGPASDPDRLDADHDGIACESSPCPCNYSTTPTASVAVPVPAPPPPSPPAAPIPAPVAGHRTSVRIWRVVDGDTVKVKTSSGAIRTVRLIGIDTPESVAPSTPVECGARRATAAMDKLALRREHGGLVGRPATLVSDPSQDAKDRYGRTLAYVEIGGRDVGRRQIRAGLATVYVFRAPFRRLATYTAAQSAARDAADGLWAACGGNFHKAP
jgi:endonuclease YncB( thermonuclease family)